MVTYMPMRHRATELFVKFDHGPDALFDFVIEKLNLNGGYEINVSPTDYKLTLEAKTYESDSRTKITISLKFFQIKDSND